MEHIKGKLDNNLKDGNVYCGGMVVANCYSSFLSPVTIKANAARFAVCWNEYDQLKEENTLLKEQNRILKEAAQSTLEKLKSLMNDPAWTTSPFSVWNEAKELNEALNKVNS